MTVWTTDNETSRFNYDSQKQSYQIWLDKPGNLISGDVENHIILDRDDWQGALAIGPELSKKPDLIEYGPNNHWSVLAFFASQEPQGEKAETDSSGQELAQWRITIDVQALDIVHALAEAYRGNNASITRI